VAVEFALLLPILLLIIFGVIDFGRMINAQITLTQAAREGARLASLGYSTSAVQTRAQNAATGLSPVTVTVSSSCPAGAGMGVDAVVQTSYQFSFVTPVGAFASMFGSASFGSSTVTLTATGDYPCETLFPACPARQSWPGVAPPLEPPAGPRPRSSVTGPRPGGCRAGTSAASSAWSPGF
jgi:Flp pilus assembly protein TadG